jgi:hypothetical protein
MYAGANKGHPYRGSGLVRLQWSSLIDCKARIGLTMCDKALIQFGHVYPKNFRGRTLGGCNTSKRKANE